MKCALFILLLGCLLLAPAPSHATDFVVGINDTEENARDNPEIRNLLQETFRRMGVKMRIVYLPLSRSLLDVSQGDVDGVAAHFKVEVEEFDNLVTVPQPMARISYGVFSNAKIGTVKSWDDLAGRTLGIVRGDLPPRIEAMKRGIRIYDLNNGGNGFRMLQAGRLDAMVYEKNFGILHLREAVLDKVVESPLNLEGYTYFVLHERHADLAPKMARAFRDMLRDGSYALLLGRFNALTPPITAED
ncbi:substrate-binding periplasmic protein [Salidesulfovibrio onnuriiensis]|uniref:substrate-binding periplasmic protein n=1 Tax=Salidesulfovibrio onnuriiensis TaxID=2583823 RepID=UPI0011CAF200|nr:transporter substrate-binding domain-containing protein [Salidesulfovibrio onnuriiensis]